MKKKGYYEYDPEIYPRKLWVHIGNDFKDVVNSEFDGIILPDDEEEYAGVTYEKAERKSDKRYGILVSFPSKKDMTMGNVSHESSHVVDAIEKACGIDHGDEPSAYLFGWVASCINKARLGQGNFIEIIKIKEKEEQKNEDIIIGEIISFSLKYGYKVVGCYNGITKEDGICVNPCIMRNAKLDGEWVLNADEKGRFEEIVFAKSAARNLRLANTEEVDVYLKATKKYGKTRKD